MSDNTSSFVAIGAFALSVVGLAVIKIKRSGVGSPHPSRSMFKDCAYLDWNATSPIFPEVQQAMLPYTLTHFGNPSSPHIYGTVCAAAISTARSHVARMIRSKPSNIIFTSCGSESDNRAIDIALYHYGTDPRGKSNSKPQVITCSIEHPAVLVYLQTLEKIGRIRLSIIEVDNEGFVHVNDIARELTKTTALVTIMHSNNEVGTIQPIRDIALVIKNFNLKNNVNILLHSDGAQSAGKVRLDVESLQVDLFTLVGHKFGAPKGVAALYIRRDDVRCEPLLVGGGQEFGLRAGTENVGLIIALGEASRLAYEEEQEELEHMIKLKRRLLQRLSLCVNQATTKIHYKLNGPMTDNSADGLDKLTFGMGLSLDPSGLLGQLPNTVSVSFKDIKMYEVMPSLFEKVACSAGSACHTGHAALDIVSPVLAAMKVPREFALGTFRLSFGRHTTEHEVDYAIKTLVSTIDMWFNSKRERKAS